MWVYNNTINSIAYFTAENSAIHQFAKFALNYRYNEDLVVLGYHTLTVGLYNKNEFTFVPDTQYNLVIRSYESHINIEGYYEKYQYVPIWNRVYSNNSAVSVLFGKNTVIPFGKPYSIDVEEPLSPMSNSLYAAEYKDLMLHGYVEDDYEVEDYYSDVDDTPYVEETVDESQFDAKWWNKRME
jgi:hypothetical protein